MNCTMFVTTVFYMISVINQLKYNNKYIFFFYYQVLTHYVRAFYLQSA